MTRRTRLPPGRPHRWSRPGAHRRYCVAILLAWGTYGARAAGDEPNRASSPEAISGTERERVQQGDAARTLGDAALWPVRELVDAVFAATGVAAGLIEDEQVVPRVADLLEPQEGEVHVFPTAFLETGAGFNVGARMLARARRFASTARVGYGGADEIVLDSRVRQSVVEPVPTALDVEAHADVRERGYLGVGQSPATDARNRFAAGAAGRGARYVENRERFIAGAGLRPLSDVEIFASASYTQRTTRDPDDAGTHALSRVFLPGTVPGALDTKRFIYGEMASRLDTRTERGRPSVGLLIESYAGLSTGLGGTDSRFARLGGRSAGFIGVARKSNILSPRIVLDAVRNVGGEPIPFNELAAQPDFRGSDTRVDTVSSVASLDYRWAIWRYLAARLFVDAATVAARVDELRPAEARWAAGFGFDVFSRNALLGSLALSGSRDGARLLLKIGVASGFGDRQHRK